MFNPLRPRHRIAWLLSLMLLVPLAQSLATWHVLSHVHQVAAQEGRGTPDASGCGKHCDLCIMAAAVIGGIHSGSCALSLSATTASHIQPVDPDRTLWAAVTVLPYFSRAPPHLLQ